MNISYLILDVFNHWTVPTSTIILANTIKPMAQHAFLLATNVNLQGAAMLL